MSNRTLTIILVALVIIAIAFGAFWLLTATTGTAPAGGAGNPFGGLGNATGTSSGGGSQGQGGSGTVAITAKDGSTVTVPDFRPGKESVNEGNVTFYYLTQSNQGQGQDNSQFDIIYGTDSSVTVSLLAEPIGAARAAAEAALRSYFPVSDAQLCQMNVIVAVPNDVNAQYSGENLGLSFCPGAMQLPN
jgi:hypothetical protein